MFPKFFTSPALMLAVCAVLCCRVSYAAGAVGCTAADKALISSYSEAAVSALESGDLDRFISLSMEADRKLSAACNALLARTEPARVDCSSDERMAAMKGYAAILQAVANSDVMEALDVLEALRASLSDRCWIAVNYTQNRGVRQSCTAPELNVLAAAAGPGVKALRNVLRTGDPSEVLSMAQQLSALVSSDCLLAIQRSQMPSGSRGPSPSVPGSIIDHGGGTYSMPGVGACTPSGCMAF